MDDCKILFTLVALYAVQQIFCTLNKESLQPTTSNTFEAHTNRQSISKPANGINNRTTNVVLYAKSRTGSTFTATVLQKIPESFFSFEPLNMVEYKTLPKTGVDLVHEVLSCNFRRIYKECLGSRGSKHCNMWSAFAFCDYGDSEEKITCKKSKIAKKEEMCKATNIRSTKIVRLQYLKQLLIPPFDKSDYKIIFLLRDPRAMLQSRFFYKEGIGLKDLPREKLQNAARRSCGETAADLKFLKSMKNYKAHILVIRYEDMVMNSIFEARRIYKFIGYRESPYVFCWLEDEQNRAAGKSKMTNFTENPRSVYRNNMTATALKWKKNIPFDVVNFIQLNCKEALKLAGYRTVSSQQDLDSDENNVVSRFIL